MANQAKKFGTIAGVYTPSVLTILGVIMYMRLGWVIGESGLYVALAIIVIAHIISVSTGLSLSSIATDKKIKAGGIYYILSRSLGLPMGGAIGITIFVGTALSISLYIIGFCESFLGIPAISEFLGLTASVADYRIMGTFVIIGLVVLAFISTSLAIKSQFVILGAIALSIISIVVGLITNTEFHPQEALLLPNPKHIPFEVVFAIFFPAVTGFTAGVAMSGDLKDPKKAIPLGTMTSIITGLVVYVSLAIAFAFFVDRDLLINDNNFLLKVAWFAPLVIAGVWGATLSSALGGILGGPRIIQAISKDKITPKFLGKGHGPSNEPRNALIFTFVLAEIGILIGELDVIAGIVSMFYLAAYGFINLAYFLESWASSDFRPTFRISKWIGLVGFVASLFVMFKIDSLSMVVAFVIMIALFFLLKRKEIRLDYGDVWQSVGASIIRSILDKLDKKGLEQRNWKPNIILFSGGTENRPHLIEIGKAFVGRQGFLSNFDLTKSDDGKEHHPFHKQAVISDDSEQFQGVFARQKVVKDIYEGITNISSSYGFAGVEPNTVMLGWARQTADAKRFGEMVKNISDLDHNIVMIDYDKKRGYGKYKKIDIWWRGSGNNGNFALSLVKFMLISEEWRMASVRLLIVNPIDDDKDAIYHSTKRVLDKLRFTADIHIINNQIHQRSFYDIIETESVNSDLTFLGFPHIEAGKTELFVETTNKLCRNIGTVILIKASSTFKTLKIGVKENDYLRPKKIAEKTRPIVEPIAEEYKINWPKKTALANQLQIFHQVVRESAEKNLNEVFQDVHNSTELITDQFENIVEKAFIFIKGKNYSVSKQFFHRFRNSLSEKTRNSIAKYQKENLPEHQRKLMVGISQLLDDFDSFPLLFTEKLPVKYKKDEFDESSLSSQKDRKFARNIKLRNLLSGNEIWNKIYLREIIQTSINQNSYDIVADSYSKFGLVGMQFVVELQRLIKEVRRVFLVLELESAKKTLNDTILDEKQREIELAFSRIRKLMNAAYPNIYASIFDSINKQVSFLSDGFNSINPNSLIPEYEISKPKKLIRNLQSLPEEWTYNQQLLYNVSKLELDLFVVNGASSEIYKKGRIILSDSLSVLIMTPLELLKKQMSNLENGNSLEISKLDWIAPDFDIINNRLEDFQNEMQERLQKLLHIFPETLEIMDSQSVNSFKENQYSDIQTASLSVSKMMNFIIQNDIVGPFQQFRNDVVNDFQEVLNSGQDIVNMVSFALLSKKSENGDQKTEEDFALLIERQTQRLDTIIEDAKTQLKIIEHKVNERIYAIEDRLTLSQFVSNTLDFKTYVRNNATNNRITKIRSWLSSVDEVISNQLNQLWYKQSKGIMLELRTKDDNTLDVVGIDAVLNLTESLSPKPKVLQSLPFYYKQMFVGKKQFLSDFWVGRKRELNAASKSIDRFRAGRNGGLMILGEHNSGKSFFLRYLLEKECPDTEPAFVCAPVGGSTSVNQFEKAIQKAIGKENSPIDSALKYDVDRAIIVIDDLELWWEKVSGGLLVLNRLAQLIDEFGDKHFFIVSANIHSYAVIQKLINLNNHFLNVITLSPFSAEDLQKVVLTRHQSGQLHFATNRRNEENFRSWNYARFFSRLFNYSKGNVGVALSAWLVNVDNFSDGRLQLGILRSQESNPLSFFNVDHWMLVLQLLLHKSASLDKLKRITAIDNDEQHLLIEYLSVLERAGVVEHDVCAGKSVYILNSNMIPILQQRLKSMELL